MVLPKFVVIKSASNNAYLQLPYGENTLLKFKEVGSDSKGYKHEVEEAKSEAGLVHIKCCETGKYWTLAGMHSNIIAAEADKPVEDGTSAACTLIKPTLKYIDGIPVVNFQFQRQSKWQSVFANSTGCLESSENLAGNFILSDWEKLQRPHPNKSTGTAFGVFAGGFALLLLWLFWCQVRVLPSVRHWVAFARVCLVLLIFVILIKINIFFLLSKKKKSTGTSSRGNLTVEGIEIENGAFIAGVEAGGQGHLSVLGTSIGVGSSARDGVSVGDANIGPGVVLDEGTFTLRKRIIRGGLRIGYPPT